MKDKAEVIMIGRTTKTAYCGNCNKPIQAVHQEKCEYCGSKLDWNKIKFSEKEIL